MVDCSEENGKQSKDKGANATLFAKIPALQQTSTPNAWGEVDFHVHAVLAGENCLGNYCTVEKMMVAARGHFVLPVPYPSRTAPALPHGWFFDVSELCALGLAVLPACPFTG